MESILEEDVADKLADELTGKPGSSTCCRSLTKGLIARNASRIPDDYY